MKFLKKEEKTHIIKLKNRINKMINIIRINKMYRDELKENITNKLKIKELPEEVKISTITLTCKMNIEFNVENIAKNIDLNPKCIVKVSHGQNNDKSTNRSIIIDKKKRRENKQKKIFYNQVTICVKVVSKEENPVNVKVFSNGSIQMTGCKTIDNIIETFEQIFSELIKEKTFIKLKNKTNENLNDKSNKINDKTEDKTNEKIEDKTNEKIEDKMEEIKLERINRIQIDMINSCFKIPFKINRDKLYQKLMKDKYKCTYNPSIHACVNIKYNNEEKTISIFVFEKGSILITGAKNCEDILQAYNFINPYLLINYDNIVIK